MMTELTLIVVGAVRGTGAQSPAYELLVFGRRSLEEPRAMLTHDPWVLGFVFLLGVIVGHYFSTVCPY